mmetsp:Transcript_81105/g.178147  ORF Transcript_81105/g.178147 Transcript_81105/m.178147 type:complete len:124 (+) Transcript_81105:2015-2386(+)
MTSVLALARYNCLRKLCNSRSIVCCWDRNRAFSDSDFWHAGHLWKGCDAAKGEKEAEGEGEEATGGGGRLIILELGADIVMVAVAEPVAFMEAVAKAAGGGTGAPSSSSAGGGDCDGVRPNPR